MDEWKTESNDNLDKHLIKPVDEYCFECRKCDICCKSSDVLILTPKDLFNIAKKLEMTLNEVVDEYCETFIEDLSHLPTVRLKPHGMSNPCPLLHNKRCIVHDAKPVDCALYPSERRVVCGTSNQQNSAFNWLEKFGVPVEDEFYIKWNEDIIQFSAYVRDLEERNAPELILKLVGSAIYANLYVTYDTSHQFMSQFVRNTLILREKLADLKTELF